MNYEEIHAKVMACEYGQRWNEGVLYYRIDHHAKVVRVFTVSKWRVVTSFQKRWLDHGCLLSPRLVRYVLLSLARNGGLIPGKRMEEHRLVSAEVK